MSHVRVEEIDDFYIPWTDILIACTIITLIILKLKS